MGKKLISAILVAAVGISLFSGCGGKEYEADLPKEMEEAEIFVEKIDNLPEDFIKGMDISSVIAEEESGVRYYDRDGKEQDLFKLLADAGVNYIRVRVWNNPYDKDGNGFGGGNCDVAKAATIGKRAAEYGMKLLVDFHYSDFWADPNKQYAPVAWRKKSIEEKQQLLYDFTVDSLNEIMKEGADVGMVQIGNEINNGMSSEYETAGVMALLTSASQAVRAVAKDSDKDIKIAVHYTEIDNAKDTYKRAADLEKYGVDYDIFGVSYYPYWHGTMDNMTEVLTTIKADYGKDTCVLETSYCYTGEDGDQSGNSICEDDCLEEYPVSPQGQANCVRDVMAHANDAGALGVFYWEGAWIPVGDSYESNQEIWEKYGSGWASSYASEYDAQDAGKYYGGSSWDNQAFFDFSGKALPSLDVFKYVNYGAKATLEVLAYKEIIIESSLNQEVQMPSEVEAIYNDSSENSKIPVTWDEAELSAIDVTRVGEYQIDGILDNGDKVVATVKVTNVNLIKNYSFEDASAAMWEVNYIVGESYTDIQTKAADAASGERAFHFYSDGDQEFEVEQSLGTIAAGNYSFTASLQGGDVGSDAKIYLYVKVGDQIYSSSDVELAGWVNWQTPIIKDIPVDGSSEVRVGFYIKSAPKGWGTIDDLLFYSQS